MFEVRRKKETKNFKKSLSFHSLNLFKWVVSTTLSAIPSSSSSGTSQRTFFDRKLLSSFGFWLTDFKSSSCSPQSLCNRTSRENKCYSCTIEPPVLDRSQRFCVEILDLVLLSSLVVRHPALFKPNLALSVRVDFVAVHRRMCFDWKRRESALCSVWKLVVCFFL